MCVLMFVYGISIDIEYRTDCLQIDVRARMSHTLTHMADCLRVYIRNNLRLILYVRNCTHATRRASDRADWLNGICVFHHATHSYPLMYTPMSVRNGAQARIQRGDHSRLATSAAAARVRR